MRILFAAALIGAAPATAATVNFSQLFVGEQIQALDYPAVSFGSSTGRLYVGAAGGDHALCAFTGTSCDATLTASFARPVSNLRFSADGDDSAASLVFVSLTTTSGNYNFSGGGFDGNVYTASPFDLSAYTGITGIAITGNDASGLGFDDFSFDVAGVPEPASWALMLAGFGLIGHVSRRRRRVMAAV